MDIRILKLVTGEEIMGELVEDGGSITLKNPVRVAVMPGRDGNANVGFAPFPSYTDEIKDAEFDFRLEHVVYSYTPAKEFCNNYEQIFGLGLILPNEKKIITG
jgi:hypothetical protein